MIPHQCDFDSLKQCLMLIQYFYKGRVDCELETSWVIFKDLFWFIIEETLKVKTFSVNSDWFHECLETIYEIIQETWNAEIINILYDKGIILLCKNIL